jgi:hypothetical protein
MYPESRFLPLPMTRARTFTVRALGRLHDLAPETPDPCRRVTAALIAQDGSRNREPRNTAPRPAVAPPTLMATTNAVYAGRS